MNDQSEDQESGEIATDALVERVGKWYDTFINDSHFKQLTEPQKRAAWDIISFFTTYSADYLGATPETWSATTVEECCLEILPRKVSAKADFFERIAPVLAAFFHYLDDGHLLKQAGRLAKAVKPLGPQIMAEANDSGNWGMAKSFMMNAMGAGVDVTDQAALQAHMLKMNQRLAEQRRAREEQAAVPPPAPMQWQPPNPIRNENDIGRNAPCACGSGKKYKKCCGA